MRVLVLNASPKGEQSHTMAITRAFLSGFPEGTQTELLELRHLNIRPCTGCLGCWTKTPGRCVQRDDMDRVYAAIAAADVVVESFPLYFYGIPGTLKTLTDRCLPYTKAYGWSSRAVHELRDPAMLEKRLVLISTCWHTGIDRLYAAVRTAYAEYAPGYQAIFCPQGELFAIDACRRQVSALSGRCGAGGARGRADWPHRGRHGGAAGAAHPLGCDVRAHHTPALEHHRRINSGGGAFRLSTFFETDAEQSRIRSA